MKKGEGAPPVGEIGRDLSFYLNSESSALHDIEIVDSSTTKAYK
jgi:hypothetical protein